MKKTIVIISSVVAVLLIAVLTLCLVKQNPLYAAIDGYSSLTVYEAQSNDAAPEIKDENNKAVDFSATFKKSGYSVMQGLLEGKPGKNLLFKKDSAGTAVKTAVDQIRSIQAPENSYMIEFAYAAEKTVKVEGEEIKYDRARMVFGNSSNEIGNVEITFYLDGMIDNPDEDDYEVKTVVARAKTTSLYNLVKDGLAAM